MNEAGLSIRRASVEDADHLVQFNCAIARETEGKELPLKTVQQGVLRGLQQGDEVQYFVACEGDLPVACLMLTREWSDWRDGWMAWLQSVYVHPDYRGRKLFSDLLNHVTERLQNQPDVVGLRLYVENDNARAQAVYARNGFTDPHYKVLERIFATT